MPVPKSPPTKKTNNRGAGQAADDPQAPPHGVSGWGVYLLRCADGSLYTGCTNDRERRLRRHAQGAVKYTRGRLPVLIAFWDGADSKSDALKKEAAIKRFSRRDKLFLLGDPC